MKKLFPVFAAVFALITGCAKTMQLDDPNLYDQYLTKSYNQPVGTCFNAVKSAFAEKKVALTKEDAENGRIVTERHDALVYAMYTGYRTGNVTNYSGGMGKITHRYYIDVKGDENTCTIKVTKYKAWNNENEATYVKVDDIYDYYWGPLFKSFENHFNPDEE